MKSSKASIVMPVLLLVSLVGVSNSLAQLAPVHRMPFAEHDERYDNPPAPPRKVETSPRMISQFGVFTSYQVNVNANHQNIIGDAANECVIAVDPTNPNKMTVGWRQFNDVTSNFRQGGWGYTTDAGLTWTFPGVLENNVFRSDPVTKSNETGNFFYLSLQSNVQQSFFCDDLWRSTNGGQSWTLLSGERGAGGGDKQWFTIDKTAGPGHGFQYQADDGINCSGGGVQFQRSTDGGVTWQSPVTIPNGPVYGTLDVDSNGNVFVGGEGNTFYCIRSSNAQIGNQTPTFDRVTPVNMGGDLSSGGINGVGLTGMLFLAIDHSGGSTNNNIYMLASVVPPGRSTTDVMFVRSTDGGLTFSAPHKVNDDPVNPSKWHWFGTFAVAPSGRLDAVWYDTRNAANNTDSQLFYSYSTDAGVTWSANVAVSSPFNPLEGYPNQSKIGDYITVVSDDTGGNVAYSATFNFNPNRSQHEEDVYYVRVFPTGRRNATPTPRLAYTYCDSDGVAHGNAHAYRYCYCHCYSHGDCHCYSHATATATATATVQQQQCNSYSYSYSYRDRYCNSHPDAHCYTDCQRFGHSYGDSNINSYRHPKTHADPQIRADTKAPAHATAEAVVHSTLKVATLRKSRQDEGLSRSGR
jgi:hypothetical protein